MSKIPIIHMNTCAHLPHTLLKVTNESSSTDKFHNQYKHTYKPNQAHTELYVSMIKAVVHLLSIY